MPALRVSAIASAIAVCCFAVLPPALIERGDDNLSFDEASKIEILSFAKTILSEPFLTREYLAPKLDLKADQINLESVNKIRFRTLKNLLINYQAAIGDQNGELSRSTPEAQLKRLTQNFTVDSAKEKFYRAYFYEQSRLAALFPKISSEIDRFNDSEILGTEFNDRVFYLTYDDGPSDQNSSTDRLIKALNDRNINAVFFALGSAAQKRENDLADLYKNQCLASHGWIHTSHAKNAKEALKSIEQSANLLNAYAHNSYIAAFRPPYGRRDPSFHDKAKIVLWNIDSQDWQKTVSAKAAADRVLTLMLVWRKGIVLFHDIYDKAETALPLIYDRAKRWNLSFANCRSII
ncbi:MAG: polysaccharide deacetylase family protein [Helicobacteraceae bacterium]|jgi:peptidoglycan/xylan/chitin deacetylase (PgdA/CDA1 family)|nr:polysaccharide deacetylase family protein [Helicobacteraceae bacterium]